MASKKKESEGIALLSMYNDEDEEMEDTYQEDEQQQQQCVRIEDNNSDESGRGTSTSDRLQEPNPPLQSHYSLPLIQDPTPPKTDDNRVPTPTLPTQFWSSSSSSSSSSPAQQQQHFQPPPRSQPTTTRKQALAIVDYAHDETAMSPEAEEGEIMGTGHIMLGEDLQPTEGNSQEKAITGTDHSQSPNTETTVPQLSEQPQLSPSDRVMNYEKMESETTGIEQAGEMQNDVDPLEKFFPPPPQSKCSDELQDKINKFLALKGAGKSFNAEVRNRKDYRNPDFLLHAVSYQEIDQFGSCFSKDVFDPHGYDKSDFYDEIEADMKREIERKEQEKKKSQKVEFVTGGTQSGMIALAPKTGMQIPVGPPVSASGFHSHPTAADSMGRESRRSKKSKWDKVDGDRKNPLTGGQDSIATAATHAALLSAANVGAGYSAFALQLATSTKSYYSEAGVDYAHEKMQ